MHGSRLVESPAERVDARLVPAALTCWVVTAAGIWWPIGRAVAACCVVLVAASGALAWRARRRRGETGRLRAVSAGLVAVGVTGAGFGFAVALRAEAVDRHPITAAFGTAAPVTVTPTESPVSLGRGRLMFRATLQRLRGAEISGRVVVFARASDFESETDGLMVGRPVRFTARIGRPTRRDLTVAVLNASGRPTAGTAGAVQRAAHTVRGRFAAAVRGTLPAEQAAMLPALVLGDTSAVTAETDRDFRAAGMTHLMAVSGANVTIVCAAVLFSARLIGPRAAVVLAALALVAFVVVVQPTASVLRAALMGAIGLAGMLSSRRRQAIPALCATVLGLLAIAPQLAVDVGFALSAVATAALVVVAPAWSRRLAGRGCPKPLADALAIAAAAHAGDRSAGGRHLRAGQPGGRDRQPRGGAGDSADHRARQRGGRVERGVAVRCAAVDPFHRPRTVVGGAGGALVGRRPRGDGARSVRGARSAVGRRGDRVDRHSGHAATRPALVRRRGRSGRADGCPLRAGLVVVEAVGSRAA